MGEPQLPILHELPRLAGTEQELRVVPEMRVVGEHDEEVLVVLPREHGVAAVDAPREERHAFVLHRAAVEREDAEGEEVVRLDELRQDDAAVVGGVGGVVRRREPSSSTKRTKRASSMPLLSLAETGKMMRSLMASFGTKRSS